ncbi:hypothetical protein B0H10DRAFT_2221433 [Mycena sp. CBHHK59/15]|nr:hypothetical protein B0H10DRAFT_2221433 [Mycena sp. CBHHK59/15]
MKRKKPTEVQITARLHNLPRNKENITPPCSAPKPPPKPIAKSKDWKHEYQKLQRKYRHSKMRQNKLEAELSSFKLTDTTSRRMADSSAKHVTELGAIITKLVAEQHEKSATSKDTTETLRKQIKALKQHVHRSVKSLSRTMEQAKKKWSVCRLTKKGI